jgi:hypothetical protein
MFVEQVNAQLNDVVETFRDRASVQPSPPALAAPAAQPPGQQSRSGKRTMTKKPAARRRR